MPKMLRAALLAVAAILLLLLCGCHTQKDSALTIDRNFTGTRVIECTVSRAELGNLLSGGENTLDLLLDQSAPPGLRLEKTEEGKNLLYRFTLEFQGLSDYISQITSLLGREPAVVFAAPDTPFAQGFRLKEDFSSTDLLQWLNTAAQAQKLAAEGTQLLAAGKTNVYFDGQAFFSEGNRISVQAFSYHPVDKIMIDTQMLYDGTFERTLAYQIPQNTCDQLASTLEPYMQTLIPTDGRGDWSSLATGRLFTLTFKASSPQELTQKTNRALGNENGTAKVQKEQDTLLSKQLIFGETLDFSSFPSGRQIKTFVEYRFSTDSSTGLSGAKLLENNAWRDAGAYLENGSFFLYGDRDILDVQIQSEISYALDSIAIHTVQTSESTYERKLQLLFTGTGARAGAARAASYLNQQGALGSAAQYEGNLCTLTLSGGIPELNTALANLFGDGNQLSLSTSEGFELFHKTTLKETVNLKTFCEQTGFTGEIAYTYTDLNGADRIIRTSPTEEATAFVYETQALNARFAATLGGFCLAVLLVLLLIFLLLRKKRQVRRPLTGDPDGHNLTPLDLLCPYCGAELYDGMDYCTGCSRPVDYLVREETDTLKKEVR